MNDLQTTLDALASPVRREILWMLGDRELPAGEIAAAFDLSAPTISEHLATLRRAGLVQMRRQGTFRFYRADRSALRSVRALVVDDDVRWQAADGIPETAHATARTTGLVVATVELDCSVDDAFRCFADGSLCRAWMGVPVEIVDGRFAADLEFGTRVRGVYEVVVPPSLIAMRWDFASDDLPVPGGEMSGYLRFEGDARRTRVTVHQIVDDETQAAFMQTAWSLVLGRAREGCGAALAGERAATRATRPRRRGSGR